MALFIKQIANKLSGQVAISIPDAVEGYSEIVGFLTEDPVIKMGNRWEPLIPDLTSINDFSALANWGAASWVSTSKMAWRGTDPITVGLNFYLITFLKAQVDGTGSGASAPISKQATKLAKLAAISQGTNSIVTEDLSINVHGGYKPNYFESNNHIINNNMLGKMGAGSVNTVGDDGSGACQIVINGDGMNSVVFKDMLLESIDMTPSTVRAGYWDGFINGGGDNIGTFRGSAEPLYIKVNANFKLMRVALTSDVERLFGGKYGI